MRSMWWILMHELMSSVCCGPWAPSLSWCWWTWSPYGCPLTSSQKWEWTKLCILPKSAEEELEQPGWAGEGGHPSVPLWLWSSSPQQSSGLDGPVCRTAHTAKRGIPSSRYGACSHKCMGEGSTVKKRAQGQGRTARGGLLLWRS